MTVTLDLDACPTDSSTRRTLATLSLAVAKSKRIVVLTGAGISCSSGIPDFRSSDGLYALVKQRYPDVVLKGRDLFDSSLFRNPTSTAVFYTFISQLKRSIDSASPTPTHRFLKALDTRKKLLRSYTQNIDGLEERAGLMGSSSQEAKSHGKGKAKIRIKDVRSVQLHGDIHRVRCTFCSAEYPCSEDHLKSFNTGVPPNCPECTSRSNERVARSARALKVGTLRPAIVLYDEPHPLGDDIGSIQSADIVRKPDMLIIMGTSLKVYGFKKLVKDFAKTVRAAAPPSPQKGAKSMAGKVVFVNKTAPGSEWDGIIDYHVAGDTDAWVEKVVEDWKKARPADWEVQKTLVASGGEAAGKFAVTKEVTNTLGAKGKGGKRKDNIGRENFPPLEPEEPPAVSTLPPLPPSPSKRRQSDNHYSDVECSPSKKRDAGTRPDPVVFEERGLLFGDATNNAKDAATEDDFDLGELKHQTPKMKERRPSTTAKAAKKTEVVLDKTKPVKKGSRSTKTAAR